MRRVEKLLLDPSFNEVDISVQNLKPYESSCTFQIPTELSQAGGKTLHTEIHKIINSIWNKEELLHQWKECIIVPIFIKGDKTDCSNYRGISLLPTYKILSNIHVSRLTPYRDKIIGDQQCRFQHNRSATDTYILHLLDTGEKVRI